MQIRKSHLLLAAVFVVVLVQGCANVAMSGASAVYNRRSLQKNINDQYVTLQAYHALNVDNAKFKNANLTIATYNGEVLLAGQTPEPWQPAMVEQIVKKIPDVKHVYNLVKVESPTSSLKRINDAWLTTKVKAKLIASDDVDATQVKVVTENGTVYLMGILLPEEAQAAVDIASHTDGVVSVVKMFSYVKISKSA